MGKGTSNLHSLFFALYAVPTISLLISYLYFFHQVREQGQQKGEASPYLTELLHLEEQAKQQGLGRWSKVILLFIWFYLLFLLTVSCKE